MLIGAMLTAAECEHSQVILPQIFFPTASLWKTSRFPLPDYTSQHDWKPETCYLWEIAAQMLCLSLCGMQSFQCKILHHLNSLKYNLSNYIFWHRSQKKINLKKKQGLYYCPILFALDKAVVITILVLLLFTWSQHSTLGRKFQDFDLAIMNERKYISTSLWRVAQNKIEGLGVATFLLPLELHKVVGSFMEDIWPLIAVYFHVETTPVELGVNIQCEG